jgi:putative hydrolase of the HAD superfamily
MEQPKVIFLDAVGTLFGVKGSVGEVYSAIAHRFGVDIPSTALQKAFVKHFKAASPMVEREIPTEKLLDHEYQWWETIAQGTFQEVGFYNQFGNFSAFFVQLYDHFATADPWYVYPDVLLALEEWRSRGIELGIISNFDSRLKSVLEALNLKDYFQSVTISSEVGAAKPEPQIFQVALGKHECPPQSAWHIGDSSTEDYEGAKAVGMQAYLIRR